MATYQDDGRMPAGFAEVYRAELRGRRAWTLSLWQRFEDEAAMPASPERVVAIGQPTLEYGSSSGGGSVWDSLLPSALKVSLRDPAQDVYALLSEALAAGKRDTSVRLALASRDGMYYWQGLVRLDVVETLLTGATRVPTVQVRAYCGLADITQSDQVVREENSLHALYASVLTRSLARLPIEYRQPTRAPEMDVGPAMSQWSIRSLQSQPQYELTRLAGAGTWMPRKVFDLAGYSFPMSREESLRIAAQSFLQRVWQTFSGRWRVAPPFRFEAGPAFETYTFSSGETGAIAGESLSYGAHPEDAAEAGAFDGEAVRGLGEVLGRLSVARSGVQRSGGVVRDAFLGELDTYWNPSPGVVSYTYRDAPAERPRPIAARIPDGDHIEQRLTVLSPESELYLRLEMDWAGEVTEGADGDASAHVTLEARPSMPGETGAQPYTLQLDDAKRPFWGGVSVPEVGGIVMPPTSPQDLVAGDFEELRVPGVPPPPETSLLVLRVENVASHDLIVDRLALVVTDADDQRLGKLDLPVLFTPDAAQEGANGEVFYRGNQEVKIERPFVAATDEEFSHERDPAVAARAVEGVVIGTGAVTNRLAASAFALPDGSVFADLADLQADLILRRNAGGRLSRIEGTTRGLWPPERVLERGGQEFVLLGGTLRILPEQTDGMWAERPPVGVPYG